MTDLAETVVPVLGLALVDSINPSALAIALYWLSQPSPVPRVLAYVAGIALTYLALGVALMLGFGTVAAQFGHWFDHPIALGVQLALGVAMAGYGIFAPKASAEEPAQRQPSRAGLVGMLLLGATVTAIELTTALPYFAALALMTSAQLSWPTWLPLLVVYNAIFVAPPLALVGLHALAGQRLRERFERWRVKLQRGAREAMLWIVTLVGFALAIDAGARFKAPASQNAEPRTEAVSAHHATIARPGTSPVGEFENIVHVNQFDLASELGRPMTLPVGIVSGAPPFDDADRRTGCPDLRVDVTINSRIAEDDDGLGLANCRFQPVPIRLKYT